MAESQCHTNKLGPATFEFGVNLYKLLSNRESSNVFLSPFSISSLVSMVGMGASGSTSQQIKTVLRIPEQSSSFYSSIEQYQELLKSTKYDVILSSATRLYVANRVTVLPEFKANARSIYEADTITTDFVSDPESTANEINLWACEKTCGKIKNIVTKDSLSATTAMLLINAVHFKGIWSNKFDISSTVVKPFRTSKKEEIGVSMMHQTEYFKIGQSENMHCDVIELPYGSLELSMFVFLPFETEGLGNLEVNLSSENIQHAMRNLHDEEVALSLPRFQVESNYELNDALTGLGMVEAFQENVADFSGIDGTQLLFVSRVHHKTFVEVNEEGTEAAAVSSMDCYDGWSPIPKQFVADHPFLFIIRDNRADVLLFIGRIVNP